MTTQAGLGPDSAAKRIIWPKKPYLRYSGELPYLTCRPDLVTDGSDQVMDALGEPPPAEAPGPAVEPPAAADARM
eukprot:CAMPEP_0119270660 /NCGR_PEP_ID=MMETSP1329-20130426/7574_1 /TAXON_ID=114041 /ORGANISM="Genus nov. species nov., Strain RCC1024" /LENGTH=74 /DNA_ID=CAMNT_0007270685 /DNA_START=125 /DNA_END=349 /DNA_ORIENTATION=+